MKGDWFVRKSRHKKSVLEISKTDKVCYNESRELGQEKKPKQKNRRTQKWKASLKCKAVF